MELDDIAVIIIALGTIGLPFAILLVAGFGILFGFVFGSIMGLISSWMVPLIFLGAGAMVLVKLVDKGWHYALLGVATFFGLLLFGFFAWSGALNGPTNTYALLSLAPTGTSAMVSVDGVLFGAAFIVGIIGAIYASWIWKRN